MSKKIFSVILLLSAVTVIIAGVAIFGIREISDSSRTLMLTANRTANLNRINRINWERCALTLRIITNTDIAIINSIRNGAYKNTEETMANEIGLYQANIPADADALLKGRPAEIRKRWDALIATSDEVANVAALNSNVQALAMIRIAPFVLPSQAENVCAPVVKSFPVPTTTLQCSAPVSLSARWTISPHLTAERSLCILYEAPCPYSTSQTMPAKALHPPPFGAGLFESYL